MRPATTPSGRFTSRLYVIALAFWLGGAGCVLCCSADGAAAFVVAAAPAARGASAESEVSAVPSCHAPARSVPDESDVHDRRASRGTLRGPQSEEHAGSCCARARLKSDPARKPRPTDERADACARREIPQPQPFASAASPVGARSRSPDGRATYVRCQVFLI